jgi:mono/diheme cytochrome c family protein
MTTSSTTRSLLRAALLAACAASPAAWAQSRGELLYSTHCIACHTVAKHWRDNRVATDWKSLQTLVRRWQGAALLGWTEEDILEVTRHLNENFYRYAAPGDTRGWLRPDPGTVQAALPSGPAAR